MNQAQPATVESWSPHPQASPKFAREGQGYVTEANGTRTCCGGWQFVFSGLEPGQWYEISLEATFADLACVRDALLCTAHWDRMEAGQARTGFRPWDWILPEAAGEGHVRFGRIVQAPEDASDLTVRCTFRWSVTGRAVWSEPKVTLAEDRPASKPVRVAVVTGHANARPRPVESLQTNLDFYGNLCRRACEEVSPDLIALPEIALQWGLPGSSLDLAVPLTSPEVQAFGDLACTFHTRIVLGMYERDGDAVFNSAVLLGPDGKVEGTYHKVHLAVGGEAESGLMPGDGFPVVDTELGRIGFNICMDSSDAESSRMVGLLGADFLVLPIMGDHRADRWRPGPPTFGESRWQAIMRTHAMDNQLCMVVARNTAVASCVIDRKGDILAWNEGDRDYVWCDVSLADGYRTWNGGCFADVNWMQRRPHLYGAFTDETNQGSLCRATR